RPDVTGLFSMFAVAFAAATFLPFPSEILFATLQVQGATPVWLLITVASVGNTLGSVLNFGIGWHVSRFAGRPWFPATPAQMQRARIWFARWGVWTLLLSWAPMGDAVTLVAGVVRTPLWLFVLLVGLAKTARYCVLAALTLG